MYLITSPRQPNTKQTPYRVQISITTLDKTCNLFADSSYNTTTHDVILTQFIRCHSCIIYNAVTITLWYQCYLPVYDASVVQEEECKDDLG